MKIFSAMALGLLMIASVLTVMFVEGDGAGPDMKTRAGYSTHDPIEIEGDNDFTSENGVSRGSGTESDPYVIEGWDIDADDTDFGIYIGNTTRHFIIRDCRIHSASDDNGEINIISKYSNGITLNNVRNGKVLRNLLFDNACADIHLYYSDFNVIKNNTCNSVYGNTHILLEWSSNNTVIFNECDPHFRGTMNGTLTQAHGIWLLYYCNDNLISYNIVKNFTQEAILVSNNGCERATIDYNLVQFSSHGIEVSGEGHKVMDNLVSHNSGTGIYADMVHNGIISGNRMTHNLGDGLIVNYDGGMQSEGMNEVHDNIIMDNGQYGIRLHGKDSTYHNNTVTGNGKDGMHIWDHRNVIYFNQVAENQGHGIIIDAYWSDPSRAYGNMVYWNNFINNTDPAQGFDECYNNVWNASVKGNYWSDHTGPDNNSDGIVDSVYYVNLTYNVSDKRPVTTPYDIITTGPVIPMKIVTDDVTSVTVNKTYDVSYQVYDYEAYSPYKDVGPLVWSIQTNATWLSVSGANLYGTPTEDDVGRFYVNVSVSDGTDNDRHDFLLNVLAPTDNGTEPGNGTDPGDDPGNDTEPGDDPGNDTVPGNGTDPGDDPGNETEPGEDPGNGTEPGNETEPGDDPGNETEPGDDDGNDTYIWNEITNQPPASADIDPPEGKLSPGKSFILSARAMDPDLGHGDSLTYDWYIEGIGYVGSGETIELTLEEGQYTVILIVTDHYGQRTEKRMELTVLTEDLDGHSPLPLLMGFMVVVMIALMLAALFIFRRSNVQRKEPYEEPMDLDGLESAPINIRTMNGNYDLAGTGRPPMRPGREPLSPNAPMGVPSFPSLSRAEEKTFDEIRNDVLVGKRSPMKNRKKELYDLLRRREGKYDRDAYLALSSILEE